MTCGIYCIRNTKNGKCYIGSSKHTENRWKQHLTLLNTGKHHSIKLQNSWNKHGASAFEFTVLCQVEEKILLETEETYILSLNSCLNGYNMSLTAKGGTRKGAGRKATGRTTKMLRVPETVTTTEVRGLSHLKKAIVYWEGEVIRNPHDERYECVKDLIEELRGYLP